jgi:hypothetical protein
MNIKNENIKIKLFYSAASLCDDDDVNLDKNNKPRGYQKKSILITYET